MRCQGQGANCCVGHTGCDDAMFGYSVNRCHHGGSSGRAVRMVSSCGRGGNSNLVEQVIRTDCLNGCHAGT